jgi:very-short-patch-repair endonuclease
MTLTPEQRLLLEQAKRYHPVAEHRFHPTRRHRIDVAFPSVKLAVEIEGGGFIAGRHSRGLGLEKDAEKSALLAAAGWRLLRCTPRQVKTGVAWAWIQQVFLQDGVA